MDRPNRFIVRALVEGVLVEAHCPNPGRMAELLFPGVPVILERAPGPRKLAYTLVAVERSGPQGWTTVPLVSVKANQAVGSLVFPGLFPGARVVHPEYTLGNSRFDFLVEGAGTRDLVEVKACSEVEFGSALFPDAPSDRARKHLEELAEWGDRGFVPHVVFAVVHGRPEFWAPNRHTDPKFTRALKTLAPRLNLHAVVFETTSEGTTRLVDPKLPVFLPDVGSDSGHLVRVCAPDATQRQWSVVVDFYAAGFDRAVAQAPARSSFAIRGPSDRSGDLSDELGPLLRPSDPRQDPRFLGSILRWRHASSVPGRFVSS